MSSFADSARHDDPSTHGVFTMFAQGRGHTSGEKFTCVVWPCLLVIDTACLCVRFVSGAAQTPQYLFLRFLGSWCGRGRTESTFECLVCVCVCVCVIWVATHSIIFVFRHIRYVHSKRSQRRRTFSLSLSRHNQDGHPVTGDVCSAIYFHAACQQTFGRWSVSAPVSSFLRLSIYCQFL